MEIRKDVMLLNKIKIETERLKLKALTDDDANSLFSIFSDPIVMKYWNTEAWREVSQAHEFITSSTRAMSENSSLTLGVFLKDSNTLIGKIMLFSIDNESKRAEIGFGISRDFWGKGIVAEAANALIDYAFNKLNLRRIEAEVDPDNNASAKALTRLGFVQEGLLRQRWEINGVISDSAMYGLLAKDKAYSQT